MADAEFSCPECGATEDLLILASSWGRLVQEPDGNFQVEDLDPGEDPGRGREFNDYSPAMCMSCNHATIVAALLGRPEPATFGDFVDRVARLSIWDQGTPESEMGIPMDGERDSHEVLMNLIREARALRQS